MNTKKNKNDVFFFFLDNVTAELRIVVPQFFVFFVFFVVASLGEAIN